MNKRICLIFIVLLISSSAVYAQINFSAYVRAADTKENLIGASVWNTSRNSGAATNTQGYFTLRVSEKDTLVVSFVGYSSKKVVVSSRSEVQEILLESNYESLKEVSVKASFRSPQNMNRLKPAEFALIPTVGAVNDVIKAVQTYPGFNAQNEGSSQLVVRGGRPGENMYMIDEIPIIYVNHLGGFLSVFNSDIINSVDLYKEGFPAKYGGKLSSIVGITQREGDANKFEGRVTLGPMFGSVVLGGPIKSDKLTYIVSVRKTFFDGLMALGTSLSAANTFTLAYGFHDVNSKITYKPNLKNTFSLSLYQGDDYINYWTKFKSDGFDAKGRRQTIWGNWLVAAKWRKLYSNKLSNDLSLSYTQYRLKYKNVMERQDSAENPLVNNRFSSKLAEVRLQQKFDYDANDWLNLEWGLELYSRVFNPNQVNNIDFSSPVSTYNTFQADPYVQARLQILKNSHLSVGGRLNSYFNQNYKALDFSPRIAAFIGINEHNHFTMHYDRTFQYSHLLFTGGYIASNEIWVPAYEDAPRSMVDQYSVGFKSQKLWGQFDLDISLYQKYFNNITIYKDGIANIFGDADWQNKIVGNGSGEGRGLELLLSRKGKNYSGHIAYTLSNTTYQFDAINDGKAFNYDFNRPHVFYVNFSKPLNDRITLSSNWTYQTGLPFTPALGKRLIPDPENEEPNVVLIYGERNSATMKDFHRLDLGLSYKKLSKKGRNVLWTFSIYNVYNRLNAYSNFYHYTASEQNAFDLDFRDKSINRYEKSFFPIIPSFTYSIEL